MFQGFTALPNGVLDYQVDMAYSAAAFRQYLSAATNTAQYKDCGHTIESEQHGKRWHITLGPERFEGIALLKMARMDMRLQLTGYAHSEAEAFLDRFLKHYQRGGG